MENIQLVKLNLHHKAQAILCQTSSNSSQSIRLCIHEVNSSQKKKKHHPSTTVNKLDWTIEGAASATSAQKTKFLKLLLYKNKRTLINRFYSIKIQTIHSRIRFIMVRPPPAGARGKEGMWHHQRTRVRWWVGSEVGNPGTQGWQIYEWVGPC